MIAGAIMCQEDINACYQKQDEIINDLSIFPTFWYNAAKLLSALL